MIVLIILWLFVLKPSIQSAASEAVASPLGDLRSDVNKALENAGLPTMGPGEGGAASPTPARDLGIERRRGWLRRASDPGAHGRPARSSRASATPSTAASSRAPRRSFRPARCS